MTVEIGVDNITILIDFPRICRYVSFFCPVRKSHYVLKKVIVHLGLWFFQVLPQQIQKSSRLSCLEMLMLIKLLLRNISFLKITLIRLISRISHWHGICVFNRFLVVFPGTASIQSTPGMLKTSVFLTWSQLFIDTLLFHCGNSEVLCLLVSVCVVSRTLSLIKKFLLLYSR